MLDLLKKVQITVITEILVLISIKFLSIKYYLFGVHETYNEEVLYCKISLIITLIIIILQIAYFIYCEYKKKKEKKQG